VKVLLDECIHRKFMAAFASHDCTTVWDAGMAGKTNGTLLSLAEKAGFNVFMTMDKGLQYQQNLTDRRISVIVIRSRSNRLHDLLPFAEACCAAITSAQPGEVVRVGLLK
jgi:hypothetical protein